MTNQEMTTTASDDAVSNRVEQIKQNNPKRYGKMLTKLGSPEAVYDKIKTKMESQQQMSQAQQQLAELGLTDKHKNCKLIRKYKFDLDAVVSVLMDSESSDFSSESSSDDVS